jgi:hypothetical protein
MFPVVRGTRRLRSFRNSFASYQAIAFAAKLYASTNSDSPCCFHQLHPPKKSMKVFLENRRLLMSIRVLE